MQILHVLLSHIILSERRQKWLIISRGRVAVRNKLLEGVCLWTEHSTLAPFIIIITAENLWKMHFITFPLPRSCIIDYYWNPSSLIGGMDDGKVSLTGQNIANKYERAKKAIFNQKMYMVVVLMRWESSIYKTSETIFTFDCT